MARTISGGVEANLLDVTIFPFYAIEMQFDGGNVLRLWTGFGDLVFDDSVVVPVYDLTATDFAEIATAGLYAIDQAENTAQEVEYTNGVDANDGFTPKAGSSVINIGSRDYSGLSGKTSLGDYDAPAVTYFGTGNLLDISSVEETVEMAAKGATLTLSAVPTEVISLALSQPYQGRICKIFFGLFQKGRLEQQSSTDDARAYLLMQNGDTITLNTASTSLTEVFIGYMDQMSIEEGADVSTIQVKVENKLIDLERPRVGRFTSQYQKSLFPNDKGFDFVESMQDVPLTWGRKSA